MPDERTAVPRQLDFDWRCVVGAIDTDPADFASESPMMGLPMSQTFLYGSVRDGDGTIWTPMRRCAAGDGGAERLLLQTDLGSDALHVCRTGPRPASSRGVRRGCDGGAVVFESDPAAPGAPFRIRADGQKFRWIEEGVLDLEGAAVPPGLHWHLPDRVKGMYYLSQIFEVEGTVLGRAVRGFIPMDQWPTSCRSRTRRSRAAGGAPATPASPPTGSRGARSRRGTAPRRSGIAAPSANPVPGGGVSLDRRHGTFRKLRYRCGRRVAAGGSPSHPAGPASSSRA